LAFDGRSNPSALTSIRGQFWPKVLNFKEIGVSIQMVILAIQPSIAAVRRKVLKDAAKVS